MSYKAEDFVRVGDTYACLDKREQGRIIKVLSVDNNDGVLKANCVVVKQAKHNPGGKSKTRLLISRLCVHHGWQLVTMGGGRPYSKVQGNEQSKAS